MSIRFELPASIETTLRAVLPDLDQSAKEAFLVDLYRKRQLLHSDLAAALDLSRDETDGILKRYGVLDDLTLEELDAQVEALRRLVE